ncbi:DUF3696 domain-containing protein [Micromonospora echinaurantiaca]|uniref:DUF3696 domain-containing protein n=1 Tax=Micromonospora echinaurantiaca TaxID=47857 RepID=UPI0037A2825F
MISHVSITNFKRFTRLDLPLRPLTVLTGLNGAGKSTVIQALLLGRQVADDPTNRVVQLNGPYALALGEALDVLNTDATEQRIELILHSNTYRSDYVFSVPSDRSLHLKVDAAPQQGPPVLTGTGMAFNYLCAERLGPRDQLEVTARDLDDVGIGVHGEYTAQALALRETAEVREPLRHSRTLEHAVITLRTQVESWIAEILRPVRIIAQWPPGITASLIRFQEPGLLGEPIRPANMGFGFSYALPIVVAGLLAPTNGLLIVENPEAHLHPAAQSRLGRFLAQVATAGAQVIVETHSDHVLNGIRLAVAEDQEAREHNVIVHFFGQTDEPPLQIELTRRGGLTNWPKGFFDQIEEDLGRLARAKRHSRHSA